MAHGGSLIGLPPEIIQFIAEFVSLLHNPHHKLLLFADKPPQME